MNFDSLPEWDASLLSVTTSTLSSSNVPRTEWLHPEREAFSENQTLALGLLHTYFCIHPEYIEFSICPTTVPPILSPT